MKEGNVSAILSIHVPVPPMGTTVTVTVSTINPQDKIVKCKEDRIPDITPLLQHDQRETRSQLIAQYRALLHDQKNSLPTQNSIRGVLELIERGATPEQIQYDQERNRPHMGNTCYEVDRWIWDDAIEALS